MMAMINIDPLKHRAKWNDEALSLQFKLGRRGWLKGLLFWSIFAICFCVMIDYILLIESMWYRGLINFVLMFIGWYGIRFWIDAWNNFNVMSAFYREISRHKKEKGGE